MPNSKRRKNTRLTAHQSLASQPLDFTCLPRKLTIFGAEHAFTAPTLRVDTPPTGPAARLFVRRSGSTTTYSWGDDLSMADRYAVIVPSNRTELAGSKLPNGWGLFDVHGNVNEWCHDWYGPYDSAATKNDVLGIVLRDLFRRQLGFDSAATVSDPLGPSQGDRRLLRGGSFSYRTSNVRSAYRSDYLPTNRYCTNGFRPSRTYP